MIDQKRMKKNRPNLLLSFLIIGATISLAIYLGLWVGYQFVIQSDYILNGVSVAGIELGNQSRAEATNTLRNHWQEATLTLQMGSETRLISPSELGFELDVENTIAEAHRQGRNLNRDWLTPWRVLNLDLSLDSQLIPHWDVAQERLEQLSAELYQEPSEPKLEIIDGQAIAQAGAAGRAVDVEGTITIWQTNWPQKSLALTLIPLIPAKNDLTPFVPSLQTTIDSPIIITAYDPIADEELSLDLDQKTWSEWLSAEVVDNTLQLTTKEEPILRFFETINPQWHDRYLHPQEVATITSAVEQQLTTVELRLSHPAITHIVKSGETLSSIGRNYGIPYPWIQQANPNAIDLQVGDEITIPSADALLPLPIVRNKRIRISIAEQKMWAYENGVLKWEWPISTGIAESPTAPGIFQIRSHELEAYAATWNLYMPYFMGIYQPAPNIDFMNGFHGFPTRDGRNLLWTNNLGSPTTYGCILVDNAQIPDLYAWADEGVIVVIEAK